ncbi:CAP domain-containing protein [Streptomyces filamentosus]|uniref:Membrane protein n=1 Tax=Streptomyces filamentosus TaxID=67294 RepID=A0A919EIM8_STRFL|nr:CAP domain-containing protein [Streptomyces filamentosus]GHF83623.1 membrane protein [Streptomyces filamentosus]
MGRHRRSGAAPAEADYATGTDHGQGGARRRRRGHPVRTGLLGASAAVAVGAVAVATGLLPGGETLTAGSAGSSRPVATEARQAPELTTQGGATRTPADESAGTGTRTGTGSGSGGEAPTAAPKTPASASASPKAAPKATPTPTPTPAPTKTAAPSPTPSKAPARTPAAPATQAAPKPSKAPATTPAAQDSATPARTQAPATAPAQEARTSEAAGAGSTADRADAAEAEVLRLVNTERGKAGCSPLRPSEDLDRLAGALSADMANRSFFGHTDPDGATPWDRARAAGVTGLGAENIARGQVDAAAVMVSWMNSDQHRANILNCDFTTLGVGVHFADGGPWWTQDFGS